MGKRAPKPTAAGTLGKMGGRGRAGAIIPLMAIPGRAFALGATLVLVPCWARADREAPAPTKGPAVEEAPQAVQPDSAAPTLPPPPPPAERPAPPPAPAESQSPSGASTGEWIYTTQYGWLWMPFANDYTFVPKDGSAPDMYVYYPSIGWCWVVAPWVWGFGPMPYFGPYGSRFGWWGNGFGRWYGFGPAYTAWNGNGYFAGGRWSTAPARLATPGPSATRATSGWHFGGHGRGH